MANDMTLPAMGHNGGPDLDPIDAAIAPFSDYIEEAQLWADGTEVETDEQMRGVEALVKQIKAAEKAVGEARDEATKPLHSAWQAEIARWKPTILDLERLRKCLLASIEGRKKRLAAIKAEEERKARAEMWRKQQEAEEAARAAMAASSSIDAQRAAEAAMRDAKEAQEAAKAAAAAQEKGLRTVTRYEVTDHAALLRWIAKNHRDDITAFIEEWARKNHKIAVGADGLNVWTDKVAF